MAVSERPSQKKKTLRKRQNYGLRVMPWRFKIRNSDDGRAIIIGKIVPFSKHETRIRDEVLGLPIGERIGSKGTARVGFVSNPDNTKYLSVFSVYVPPEHRRKGYASQLMDKAIGIARRGGANAVRISISKKRTPLQSIIERRGFQPVFKSTPSDSMHYKLDLN